jgi:Inner membrane protein YgaP-like, transmembrane domain
MSRNESNLDRMIRVAVAVVAVVGALAVGASSVLGVVLAIVAAILVVTAAVGFCPLYRLLGISTDGRGSKVTPHV